MLIPPGTMASNPHNPPKSRPGFSPMAPGRPPNPSAINPPKPRGLIGDPPADQLGPEGIAAWLRIAHEAGDLGTATSADRETLAILCRVYDRRKAAQDEIDEKGVIVKSSTKYGEVTKANPAVAIIDRCDTVILNGLALFGLDPVHRARLHIPSDAEDDECDEFRN